MLTSHVRELVRVRAGDRCEYCLLHQEYSQLTHHIEHVVARQHGGSSELENLALACHRCNGKKGPNLTGIDPVSGAVAGLFSPRQDRWADHFRIDGVHLEGLTPIGRATVQVLGLNDARRIELRQELLLRGDFP